MRKVTDVLHDSVRGQKAKRKAKSGTSVENRKSLCWRGFLLRGRICSALLSFREVGKQCYREHRKEDPAEDDACVTTQVRVRVENDSTDSQATRSVS